MLTSTCQPNPSIQLLYFPTSRVGLIYLLSFRVDFDVSTGLSAGAIAGIVIGSCAFVLLILVVLWKKGYLGGNKEDKGNNTICVY